MALYGATLTRAGAIFGIGLVAIVPFGILSLAVTTRYLDPADFGRLSILFAVASVVTMFCGVGFLQGTMMVTYGMAEDGDDDDGVDFSEVDERPGLPGNEAKRMLGSGILIVVAMTTGLCGLVALVGTVITHQLFGSAWVDSVLWMSASAWSAGIWRMLHQIPRMERQARLWAVLMWVRPAIVVALIVAALAAGLGINGILMATTAGTLIAAAITYFISRDCFRFELRRGDAGVIWERGKYWVPLIATVAIQSNVNILLLSLITTPASVGLFQVASRIAQLPVYFADGFITAWPSMERSQISMAAKERKGRPAYMASIFSLLALGTLGMFVGVSLFADGLIRVAAPSYQSAASLIPIVAASFATWVAFRGVFRATSFPKRRYWYTFLHLVWLAPYAAVVFILVPWDASYGVAIAQIVAGIVVTALFVAVDRRGRAATPFQWKRLTVAALVAVLCVGGVQLVPGSAPLHAALSVVALLLFPTILLLTGTVSFSQISAVRTVLVGLLPRRRLRRGTKQRLTSLSGDERSAIQLLAWDRIDPEDAGELTGVSPPVLLARFVRGLRRISDGGSPTPVDHLIGEYVLHPGTTLDRDALARMLRSLGVDSLELHVLDEASEEVARVNANRNPRSSGAGLGEVGAL